MNMNSKWFVKIVSRLRFLLNAMNNSKFPFIARQNENINILISFPSWLHTFSDVIGCKLLSSMEALRHPHANSSSLVITTA